MHILYGSLPFFNLRHLEQQNNSVFCVLYVKFVYVFMLSLSGHLKNIFVFDRAKNVVIIYSCICSKALK
jgi:hypothetical protein